MAGPCITNVFATRRKNFSQWHRGFQRKPRSHWLKFLRHVAITLVIQGPGSATQLSPLTLSQSWPTLAWWRPWFCGFSSPCRPGRHVYYLSCPTSVHFRPSTQGRWTCYTEHRAFSEFPWTAFSHLLYSDLVIHAGLNLQPFPIVMNSKPLHTLVQGNQGGLAGLGKYLFFFFLPCEPNQL